MSANSDRNLLLGILGLQMDFISREQFIAATSDWVKDKSKALDQILLDQGALREDTRLLLVALVEKHLDIHGGDAGRSLAAVSSIGSVRDELKAIGDDQIEATLSIVSEDHKSFDPYSTEPFIVGTSGSGGPRFRKLRPHAKGGLGEVSVAYDSDLNREVALKEIQARFADDDNSRDRFLLEAEVTGGLEHPGIVPVYGLGKYADGRPFYAMRFVRGDSLQEAVDNFHSAKSMSESARTMELRKLLGRFVDVCQAIEYAHSRGVLHRDLKPGNVMLGRYGETLVVDWGLAKVVGRHDTHATTGEQTLQLGSSSGSAPTQMGSAIGTPAYMSPEQAAGRLDQLGQASDVYSLGATLYYVLTGQAPVHGQDPGTTLRKVQAGDFPEPCAVNALTPKPLQAICIKALSVQAEQRYTSPQELAEDVERYLADEPIAAYPEPVTIRSRRWLRKHPRWVVGLATSLLVGLFSAIAIVTIVTSMNNELRIANEQERKAKEEAEASRRDAVQSLVTALQFAPPDRVPQSISGLDSFSASWDFSKIGVASFA